VTLLDEHILDLEKLIAGYPEWLVKTGGADAYINRLRDLKQEQLSAGGVCACAPRKGAGSAAGPPATPPPR